MTGASSPCVVSGRVSAPGVAGLGDQPSGSLVAMAEGLGDHGSRGPKDEVPDGGRAGSSVGTARPRRAPSQVVGSAAVGGRHREEPVGEEVHHPGRPTACAGPRVAWWKMVGRGMRRALPYTSEGTAGTHVGWRDSRRARFPRFGLLSPVCALGGRARRGRHRPGWTAAGVR